MDPLPPHAPAGVHPEHLGEWRFVAVDGGVRVDLVHRPPIDYDKALAALPANTPEEADRVVSTALKVNGSKTLTAVKGPLERTGPGD